MNSDEYTALRAVVRDTLGSADAQLFNLVTAVTGLLTAVAYADREIDQAEAELLKSSLTRINGISRENAEMIFDVVKAGAIRISTSFLPRFTRLLVENADEATRLEVLGVLVEMAAADGTIKFEERNVLRNITSAMGLSQSQYNQLQTKYRELLQFN